MDKTKWSRENPEITNGTLVHDKVSISTLQVIDNLSNKHNWEKAATWKKITSDLSLTQEVNSKLSRRLNVVSETVYR